MGVGFDWTGLVVGIGLFLFLGNLSFQLCRHQAIGVSEAYEAYRTCALGCIAFTAIMTAYDVLGGIGNAGILWDYKLPGILQGSTQRGLSAFSLAYVATTLGCTLYFHLERRRSKYAQADAV